MFRSIRRRQVAPQTVQELSDALVKIWEEIARDTIRRLIGTGLDVVRHAYKHVGAIQNTEYHFELQNGLDCCIIFFHFDFRGVFELSSIG